MNHLTTKSANRDIKTSGKQSNVKLHPIEGKQMFGELKLKVNVGDRNKTPSRLIIDKLRNNRKSVGPNLNGTN